MGKGRLNWKRFETNRKMQNGDRRVTGDWEMKHKLSTYRNGNFYIGHRLVEKWNPRKLRNPGDGMFFNQVTAKFEVWKDGGRLSQIPWKTKWDELIWWAEKFGISTTVGKDAEV